MTLCYTPGRLWAVQLVFDCICIQICNAQPYSCHMLNYARYTATVRVLFIGMPSTRTACGSLLRTARLQLSACLWGMQFLRAHHGGATGGRGAPATFTCTQGHYRCGGASMTTLIHHAVPIEHVHVGDGGAI